MSREENNKFKNEKSFKNQYDEESNYNENYDNGNNNEENNTNNHYYNRGEFDNEILEKNKIDEKLRRKIFDKPLKIFGGICIVIGIVALMSSSITSVDNSTLAKSALSNGVSTSISAGTILSSKDANIEEKDYTISHNSSEKETKIYVWDYAGEDGDYVQVLVNGNPIGDIFMIKHKPREFTVPAIGEVQIKGIKDGGGGITYAVRYDINGTSYFNSAPEGEANTYTLIKG